MEKLQYFTHNILQSNYRIFINLFLLSLIYFAFYADSYYTFCMTHAGPSESKEDIIKELRRQVLALRTEKDFLTNNLNNTTKEMFDYKHEHLNELKQLRDENRNLQLKQLQQTILETPSETKVDVEPKLTRGARRKLKLMAKAAEAKAPPPVIIPLVDESIKAESLEAFNAPLREANRKLQQDYNNLLREMQARTLRPLCEDKFTQTVPEVPDDIVQPKRKVNPIRFNLNSLNYHEEVQLKQIFLNENVTEKLNLLSQNVQELEQNLTEQLETKTHSFYRNQYLVQPNGTLRPDASSSLQYELKEQKKTCIKNFIQKQFDDNPRYLLHHNISENVLNHQTDFVLNIISQKLAETKQNSFWKNWFFY